MFKVLDQYSKMPLGGLVIGFLGLIGNAFLIFLIRKSGYVFGQSSKYFSFYPDYLEKNISRRFNLKK